MKIIGLCGQSGAGKTTALEVFEKAGGGVIDCDALSRRTTEPYSACVKELVAAFGDDILCADASLNRRKLASIVFGNADACETLNRITHKYIMAEIEKELEAFLKSGYSFCVIDAPLLFESGLDKRCDVVLGVLADRETRIKRLEKRDKISREEIEKRLISQISEEELKVRCDKVLYNDGVDEVFEEQIFAFLKEIGETRE